MIYDDDVPQEFIDPFTNKIMNDPVLMNDDKTYEREEILKYLRISKKSPFTGQELSINQMTPNYQLKNRIYQYRNGLQSKSIIVKIINISGKKLKISIDDHDSISNLKSLIQVKNGMDTKFQKLMYGPKQLTNEKRLIDYGIGNKAKIFLIFRGTSG